MNEQHDLTCADFDEAIDELALGHVDEPDRGRLLGHAASCASCRADLEAAAALGDRLLLLSPESEPPAGFESRVLARLAPAAAAPASRRRWWPRLAVAAVLVLGAVLGGVAIGRNGNDRSEAVVRSGVIMSLSGNRVGSVELVKDDLPYVVVTIDHPRSGGNDVYCELRLAGGSRVRVGSWDGPDVAQHVWAVGISPEYLAAVEMAITTEDGTVVATATLD